MTTLLLIRHGETPWNALGKVQGCKNIFLSESGKAQATLLSQRLHGEDRKSVGRERVYVLV